MTSARMALALLLLAAVAVGGAPQAPPLADGVEVLYQSQRALLAVNHTCYKLCKAGTLPAAAAAAAVPTSPAVPAAASSTTTSSSTSSSTSGSTSGAAATAASTPTVPAAASAAPAASAAAAAACPMVAAGSVADTSALNASIVARLQGAKLAIGMSDFFEVFWSAGNLWTAWIDLMKQGLAASQSGQVQLDAQSVLLFNQNLASVTAYWGSTVMNIMQLSADALYPVPAGK